VIHHRRAVPFRRFNGGPGRHAQAKGTGVSQCRWPKKSAEFILGLLRNARANAQVCASYKKGGRNYAACSQDIEGERGEREREREKVNARARVGYTSC